MDVGPWYRLMHANPATFDALVTEASWYKRLNGTGHAMFLRFDISSPDKVHTSIVLAERSCSDRNSHKSASGHTQPNGTIVPMDTVAGNPLIIGVTKTNEDIAQGTNPFSNGPQRAAHDRVSYATRDSAAGTQLERMCMKAELLCTLTFPEGTRPSTNELATLLYVTSKQRPMCNLTDIQCYWFVGTVFGALRSLFEGAVQGTANDRRRTCIRVPVHIEVAAAEVCANYHAARAALAEEAERNERETVQERLRENEQRQAAEEIIRIAEAERKRVCEERQALERENTELRRQLEALKVETSTQHLMDSANKPYGYIKLTSLS
ncbi:hypothetical protein EDC04DRAFT_2739322 [Pisolithus marmoratus]|nr:hypothetical protein EDC04DRAFT_2739322 [Pisolithus marmoratus]